MKLLTKRSYYYLSSSKWRVLVEQQVKTGLIFMTFYWLQQIVNQSKVMIQ